MPRETKRDDSYGLSIRLPPKKKKRTKEGGVRVWNLEREGLFAVDPIRIEPTPANVRIAGP